MDELLAKAQANLVYIRSGAAKRDAEAQRAVAKELRRQKLERKRRIPKLRKRIAEVEKERDENQEWLNELLVTENPNPLEFAEGMTPGQVQGVLEELDAAVNGCNEELNDLHDELNALLREFSAD